MSSTSTQLKLKRVVLYKSGLGFFEKWGKLDLASQKSLKISFKSTTVNDLLKTFSIMRTKGDLMVSGVSYEGQDANLNKLLEESRIKLPDTETFNALIGQLRGYSIKFIIARKSITGTLVGLQTRTEAIGPESPTTMNVRYLLISTEKDGLQAYRIREIEQLELLDTGIKLDLNFFLDVIKSAKSEKFRNITLFFEGSKTSEFILTFLQETPAWKMSYRIFLLDDESNKENKKTTVNDENEILMQGWGIIENVLDEDWEGVKLTLASGVPISFKYDSYSPLWISRPLISRGQDLNTSVAKNQPLGGESDDFDDEFRTEKPSDTAKSPIEIVNTLIERSAAKGAGFYYQVPRTVNVKRNQASLIPIIEERIKAKFVSIYNESAHEKYPMATLEFKNTTNSILEEGPVSIFKDSVFEGEAMLSYLEKNELAKIPYAIDQSIEVHREVKNKTEKNHRVEIGTWIYTYYYQVDTTHYWVHNLTDEDKSMIIEHPIRYTYVLFDSPEPMEKTTNNYRFQIDLKPGEEKIFELHEREERSTSTQQNQIQLRILDEWLALKLINEKEYKKLKTRWNKLVRVNEIQKKMNEISSQQQKIGQEQQRLRENMESLQDSGSEKALRNRYVAKFEKREAQLEQMEKDTAALQKELETIQNELNK
jgi:hypothetical protein